MVDVEKLVNEYMDARGNRHIPTMIRENKLSKTDGQKLILGIAKRLQTWTINRFHDYQLSWFAKRITHLSHVAESLGYKELSKTLCTKYRDRWIQKDLWKTREKIQKEKQQKQKSSRKAKSSKSSVSGKELTEIYNAIKEMIKKLGGTIDEYS